MAKVKRALISVSDKEGIVEFARRLGDLGIEILSTGGTAMALKEAGLSVMDVSEYTGFPEMLNGRVKTLHPKIHGALLAKRDNPQHIDEAKRHNIEFIDLVVVNLYPFEEVTGKEGVGLDEAIENIDIGGPSMLRSAAKNFKDVAVITTPKRYADILKELKDNGCELSPETRRSLALEVFKLTSHYDNAIYRYLETNLKESPSLFPEYLSLEYKKFQDLRYGENPHQSAAFYREYQSDMGIGALRQLHGKELSFNNIMDLDAAFSIVAQFKKPASSVIKHTNPCGAAVSSTLAQAYRDALDCDRLSAFGSIVGFNKKVDKEAADAVLSGGFVECIIAPGYKKDALVALKGKKNLRIVEIPALEEVSSHQGWNLRKVAGGLLVQTQDIQDPSSSELKMVTKKKPARQEKDSLIFAWKVAKEVKSNAIVLAQGTKTVGIGAGQMSRVDSVFIACKKAGAKAYRAVLASDAFFPKTDAVELAAKAGITSIIQPGGSIKDDEVIKKADETGLSMVFTGMRHFKH